MIIKFQVNNGAWQFFDDVDSFMYRKMGEHDGLKSENDIIDYTETILKDGEILVNGSSSGYPGRVLLTFMNSKQTAQSQVVAFSPIYLMNENGKTIDVI